MRPWLAVTLFCSLVLANCGERARAADATTAVVNLTARQAEGLEVAIREMRRVGRTFRHQSIRIEEEGNTIYVSFVDVPVDMRVVGGSNGITWEIRKSDLKVVRFTLPR
jgi:hypothetical protein